MGSELSGLLRAARREAGLSQLGSLESTDDRDPSATSIDVTLDTSLGVLSFCAVQCLAGLPHDAAGASLRAELWFPADSRTASVLQQRAGQMAETP